MKSRTLIRITLAITLASLTALPLLAARGSANFTRYVAIGDSYGAGIQSGSLVLTHQQFSYPAVIARQGGTPNFQQPLVSEPGIGPELKLFSLVPLQIAPKASSNGAPINLTYPLPYNNLSIPGAKVHDVLTLNGTQPVTNTATTFAQFILRGFGTQVQQAVGINATFISVWIGGNDVLGAVLAGTPAVMTPVASFKADYETMLDSLIAGAPNAGMVVGNIPDPTLLPYATTIPPVLVNPATSKPVPGPDGNPIFLVADLGGGTIGQLTPGDLVLLPASSLIATGYGIPAALAPAFPTLPNVGKPLPDAVVLSKAEVAAIQARASEISSVISTAAGTRDIPVVDLRPLGTSLRTTGLHLGGITLSNAFLTGGIFSYDGFHLSDIGYTIFANEFIKTINQAYGADIPLASITRFFAYNAAAGSSALLYDGMPFEFTLSAWDAMLRLSGSSRSAQQILNAQEPTRGRSIRRR